jgi:serine/threonine-protein kinase
VFVARDAELGRTVALKEIQIQHLNKPAYRSRFVLEAEINGNLEHPGIVPVYGLGRYADGRPFYAMRFIEGDSLKHAIARYHREAPGMSPTDQALGLRKLLGRFIDVCDAIAYAHSRGVLHRDLKPDNVMLGRFGETLVVDWGLAKALGAAEPAPDPGSGLTGGPLVPPSGGSHEPTLAGSQLGTPGFMSPEQASGDVDHLGPATDVYSLGATLYCLLTGQAPLSGGDAIGRAIRGDVPAPRSVKPDVPRALESVCLKALSLKPEDRYPSAAALRDDVEHWLADEPVSVGREPLWTRAWRWVRKHRTLATTAAAVALVGLVSLFAAYRREARYSASLAAANTEIRRRNVDLAKANIKLDQANIGLMKANGESERWLNEAFGAIESYYTDVGGSVLRERPDLKELQKKLLARPLAFYERLTSEYAAAPPDDDRGRERLARGRVSLGRIHLTLSQNDQARVQFQSALALYESLKERRPEVLDYRAGLAVSINGLGGVLADTGRLAEAAAEYGKAIAIREDLVKRQPGVPDYQDGLAMTYTNLANLLRATARSAGAVEAYGKAIAIREGLLKRQPGVPEYQDGLRRSYGGLGNVLRDTGRTAEAVEAHRKSVAIGEDLVKRHPDIPDYGHGLATSHIGLGIVLSAGRPAEAAAEYVKAIAIVEDLVKRQPDVPEYRFRLAAVYGPLGVVLRDTGRSAEAEAAYGKSIELGDDLVKRRPDVPRYREELAMSHIGLGIVLYQAGRWAEAAEAYGKSVAIREELVKRQPDVPDYRDGLAWGYTNLGSVLRNTGRPAEAAEAHRKAIAIREELVTRLPEKPEYRSGLGAALHNLGMALEDQGRHEEALARYREAIGHQRQALDRRPQDNQSRRFLGNHYGGLASALRALGRAGEAADATREWVKLWPKDSTELYKSARSFARCIPIAGGPAQKQSLSDETMATLNAAVAAGFSDGAGVSREADLAPLRGRDDFRRLVLTLMDRAMPADPFAGRR